MPNRRDFLKLAAAIPFVPAASARSTGSVDWSRSAQQIDGFGASAAFHMAQNLRNFPEPQRTQVLDLLFSRIKGAGLSIVRNYVGDGGSWGSPVNGPAPSIAPQEGVWNWTGDEEELWIMREAGARGCTRYMSTVWSPPAWMKDNNNVIGGRLRRDKYRAFAEYLSMYVRGYKEHHGIEIYAISPANEPDVTVKYSSCYWSGQEFHDFLKELIPVFNRDKITAKLLLGEHSAWTEDPVLASLEDPETAPRVDIVGAHAYGRYSRVNFAPVSVRAGDFIKAMELKKTIWQTEVANLGPNVNTARDAVYWAKVLHTHVAENRVSGWLSWWLIAPGRSGGTLIHLDLEKKTFTVDKRLFAMGNYSRFVRPGYVRVPIDAETAPGVLVSAYKDESSRQLVIVAINENEGAQELELRLAGAGASSVAPCRTSATEDLAPLPEIAVTDNTLKTALTPESVTSFVATVTPAR
jgi:glucuronoarabinoxylan endo-1,4-beta-xylanase